MAATASEGVLDFTNVKDGGGSFNKKRQPEGDYEAKITAVADAPAKGDGVMQWMFTIQVGSGTYPYYCKHAENQLWKIRNLLIAAGMNVPKKRMKVDPNKLVGKTIAVTLEDDEYDGKAQSNIAATFPVSELSNDDIPDEDDNVDSADDDDDETPPPAAKKKKAPAPVEEDEDEDEPEAEAADEGDQFDSMDRSELKQYIAANKLEIQVFKSMDDDAIRAKIREAQPEAEEEEEEEPAPPPAKKKPAPKPAVDDDDLEEIDIDDT